MHNPKLIDKLLQRLPPAALTLLDELIALTARESVPAYLVGGPLRDLLLDRPSLDVDIVVEGEAMRLARVLAETSGGRLRQHPAFGTASVRLEAFVLDLATARAETYPRPGALPTVTPAPIREDLLRRDFTINAMALPLNAVSEDGVLDPAGGRADLRARLVRALHPAGFQDDATRILRAFRYACRLGFRIEAQTLSWIRRDLNYLQAISASRLHHEIARTLAEGAPEDILLQLDNYGVLAAIHPDLRFKRPHVGAFRHLRWLNPKAAPTAYWPILAWGIAPFAVSSLSTRLALTKPQRAALEAMADLDALQLNLHRRPIKRSTLTESLAPFPLTAVWASAALDAGSAFREHLLDYLTKARFVRPLLRGDDVIALGVPRGPQVAEVLRRLRDAKLNGEVKSRRDEESFVRRALRSRFGDGVPAHPEALEG